MYSVHTSNQPPPLKAKSGLHYLRVCHFQNIIACSCVNLCCVPVCLCVWLCVCENSEACTHEKFVRFVFFIFKYCSGTFWQLKHEWKQLCWVLYWWRVRVYSADNYFYPFGYRWVWMGKPNIVGQEDLWFEIKWVKAPTEWKRRSCLVVFTLMINRTK